MMIRRHGFLLVTSLINLQIIKTGKNLLTWTSWNQEKTPAVYGTFWPDLHWSKGVLSPWTCIMIRQRKSPGDFNETRATSLCNTGGWATDRKDLTNYAKLNTPTSLQMERRKIQNQSPKQESSRNNNIYTEPQSRASPICDNSGNITKPAPKKVWRSRIRLSIVKLYEDIAESTVVFHFGNTW